MKINPEYRLRKVGGKSIIISKRSLNLEGILTLNQTAEFIWNKIEAGAEAEDIVRALAAECDVPQDEIRGEVLGFIDVLKKSGIIE